MKKMKKTVHLIRHGQCGSNVLCEQRLAAHGLPPSSMDGAFSGAEGPAVKAAMFSALDEQQDTPLTVLGVRQARDLQSDPKLRDVELVCVSPLTRSIQTGLHAFAQPSDDISSGNHGQAPPAFEVRVPVICVEGLREYLGTEDCHRRARRELADLFPEVDFSKLLTDHDTSYGTNGKPIVTTLQEKRRASLELLRGAICEIMARPERCIAAVGHGGTLRLLLEVIAGWPTIPHFRNCDVLTVEIEKQIDTAGTHTGWNIRPVTFANAPKL